MYKNYEKIEFTPGSTIGQAIDKLLSYQQNGKLVYGKFNGVALFSDTVSIDSAYKEITGMTKAEFETKYGRRNDMTDKYQELKEKLKRLEGMYGGQLNLALKEARLAIIDLQEETKDKSE